MVIFHSYGAVYQRVSPKLSSITHLASFPSRDIPFSLSSPSENHICDVIVLVITIIIVHSFCEQIIVLVIIVITISRYIMNHYSSQFLFLSQESLHVKHNYPTNYPNHPNKYHHPNKNPPSYWYTIKLEFQFCLFIVYNMVIDVTNHPKTSKNIQKLQFATSTSFIQTITIIIWL